MDSLIFGSPLVWHRDPGDHGEVATVEGYEVRAILFGGRGDEEDDKRQHDVNLGSNK
jgi:hypothetical protein